MQVKDILKSKAGMLHTVDPQTRLSDCVIEMADRDIGSLVVMDDDRLVGLLTFREVIRVLAQRQKELRIGPTPPVAELSVVDVMERDPICAEPEMQLNDLRAMMIQHHQRYLPVLQGPALIGVVSFHDIAKAVFEEQSFENRMLKSYIQDWPIEAGQLFA